MKYALTDDDLIRIHEEIAYDKVIWRHIFSTNCYAFALGLDIRELVLMCGAYIPGEMSQTSKSIMFKPNYKYQDLLNNIYGDLDFVGIDYRQVDEDYQVSYAEWKIALFTSYLTTENGEEWINGFHFLREVENIWYHKKGWFKRPTKKDDNAQIILKPSECYLTNYEYKKVLCLSLK